MFGFLDMFGNYEDRKVGRYHDEATGVFVSTAWVNDSDPPWETAVEHPNYNGGKMVIVEHYHSREAAETGHEKWVQTMTTEPLPALLVDKSSHIFAELLDAVGGDEWREKGNSAYAED